MTKPLDQAFPLLVYTLTSCLPCEYTMMTLPDKSDNKPNNTDPCWIVDSGATIHCVGDPSLLTHVYSDQPPVRIRVANGHVLTAHAVGSATVKLADANGSKHEITLHLSLIHI